MIHLRLVLVHAPHDPFANQQLESLFAFALVHLPVLFVRPLLSFSPSLFLVLGPLRGTPTGFGFRFGGRLDRRRGGLSSCSGDCLLCKGNNSVKLGSIRNSRLRRRCFWRGRRGRFGSGKGKGPGNNGSNFELDLASVFPCVRPTGSRKRISLCDGSRCCLVVCVELYVSTVAYCYQRLTEAILLTRGIL